MFDYQYYKNIKMKNIACNLIYNDGDEGLYVGFNGICSKENIEYNVNQGNGRMCSQPNCHCKIYFESGYKKEIGIKFPCNESRLFKDWEWNPGWKFEDGKKFLILRSGANKLAILTTRYPGCTEAERKIIGFIKIKEINDNHYVIGLKEQSLRLTIDDAKELNFWNYYRNSKNPNKPDWKQGRFRYLEDDQIAAILHDLKDIVQDKKNQSIISGLLENDFRQFSVTKPSIIGALNENVVKKILLNRKYGHGGESEEHKKLKVYISQNPNKIGLQKGLVEVFLEHPFISGDLVDILFVQKKDEISTVVEIELDNVMPGIHQAIKYRVLRTSQLGLLLNNVQVKATVVAWNFSLKEKDLCNKYHVDYFEIKLTS